MYACHTYIHTYLRTYNYYLIVVRILYIHRIFYIVDVRTCVCISQAGLAGDDAPSAVFPTLVGRPRHQVCSFIHTLLTI